MPRLFSRKSPSSVSPKKIPVAITAHRYTDEAIIQESLSIQGIEPLIDTKQPIWIDISGDAQLSTLQPLGDLLGLHPLTMEDILNPDQRPKIEELSSKRFTSALYIVLKSPLISDPEEPIDFEQMNILLTPHLVVLVHHKPLATSSPLIARMAQEKEHIGRLGTDYLAYVIIDVIVDEYFKFTDLCDEQINALEQELLTSTSSEAIPQIHRLKQEVIQLKKSAWPLKEIMAGLAKTTSPLFDEQIKVYLRDLQDHIVQLVETADVYRDMLSSILDLYLSLMSHRMNQVMKALTMIASIFIPLTLVTGIYGMNFVDMPELHWKYGYPITLGIMVAIGIGMVIWFRQKRWI